MPARTIKPKFSWGTALALTFAVGVAMQLPGYPSERSRGVAQSARDIVARNGARGVVYLVDTLIPAGIMRRAAERSDAAGEGAGAERSGCGSAAGVDVNRNAVARQTSEMVTQRPRASRLNPKQAEA